MKSLGLIHHILQRHITIPNRVDRHRTIPESAGAILKVNILVIDGIDVTAAKPEATQGLDTAHPCTARVVLDTWKIRRKRLQHRIDNIGGVRKDEVTRGHPWRRTTTTAAPCQTRCPR